MLYIMGDGDNHAQVTSTLPLAGSASLLKTPGLTSRSVGAHPVPISVRTYSSSNWQNYFTSIGDCQINTSRIYHLIKSYGPNLKSAKWVGVGICTFGLRIEQEMAD